MAAMAVHETRQTSTKAGARLREEVLRRRCPLGFTLIELLVSIAIIVILLSIGLLSFRQIAQESILAQAKNAVVTYAQMARSYALANHIETMLVVNPFNGRLEIWYLNPPVQGGDWDPLSSGVTGVNDEKTDGYAFAPVLDPGAALPLRGDGVPAAAVHPIDYENRDLADGEANLDNLTWAAFCFDEEGQLVRRTRRIATRTCYYRDGTPRPFPNRLEADASPNLAVSPLVEASDTPITSAPGFVISDTSRMELVLSPPGTVTAASLVNDWLRQTRDGGAYRTFAENLVLNRYSGQELVGAR